LRTARAEAEASIIDLRRELDKAEAEMRVQGTPQPALLQSLRERVDRATEQQAKLLVEPPKAPRAAIAPPPAQVLPDRPIDVGDQIQVLRTGQEGIVTAIPPGRSEIEIQIGSFKMRAKLKDVRLVVRSEDIVQTGDSRSGGTRIVRIQTPAPSLEFDMRGWRADEVIPELERYINDAYMSNMPFVRIIHGKGTGALRQVVREELATNPLVSSFKGAESREGGEGVTIANLAV
jgi:DNA mismatch repair protein MutS2